MSKVLVTEQHLMDIASAIREKLDTQDTYRPGDMAAAIRSIEGGYPEPTGTVTISQNGTANVKDYSEASVNVPNTYTAEDEGKIVKNGALVPLNLQSKSVTQNGTVTPDSGYDGLSQVVVDVQGGSVSDNDLLFHFADFINSGKMNAVFINQTGYEISDEQSKFGGTSLKIKSAPATGGAVYLNSGFTIGTEDFTIDFWMYQTSSSTDANCVISFNYRSFGYYSKTGVIRGLVVAHTSSSWSVDHASQTKEVNILNDWHHVAITRERGTVRVFVDGVEEDSFTFADSFPLMSRLSFGTNSTIAAGWRGYIDEFRLKLGEAVWTANFNPPTQPYV